MSRRPALVVAAALALGGCGGTDTGLISEGRGDRLLDALQAAREAVDRGRCVDARRAAHQGRLESEALPRSSDPELKKALIDGFAYLEDRIGEECGRPEETPTPSPTASPSPTPSPSPSPSPTPSPTPTPTATEPPATPTPPNGGVEPVPTVGVDGEDG